MKIAIFYHALFYLGKPPELLVGAMAIVYEQMEQLKTSGLLDTCDEFVVGINGGEESRLIAERLIPPKARFVLHGLQSRAENLTIVELEKWAPSHPDYAVLYFHSKGATHKPGTPYGENTSKPWRRAMMDDLVGNWKTCVTALQAGNDIACSHWMWGMADGTQHIPAGNFLWVKSDFVKRLPSIYHRERIKVSGIDSAESRFESEVYWGNGPRPTVFQLAPNGGRGIP